MKRFSMILPGIFEIEDEYFLSVPDSLHFRAKYSIIIYLPFYINI